MISLAIVSVNKHCEYNLYKGKIYNDISDLYSDYLDICKKCNNTFEKFDKFTDIVTHIELSPFVNERDYDFALDEEMDIAYGITKVNILNLFMIL